MKNKNLLLALVALSTTFAVGCHTTSTPDGCTPLSQAPAPFEGFTQPAKSTSFSSGIFQGAGHRAGISLYVASAQKGVDPVLSTRLWDGKQWSTAEIGSVFQAGNTPALAYVGNEWIAIASTSTASGNPLSSVYWNQTNATTFSAPISFPNLSATANTQPYVMTTSAVDQHLGVVIYNYDSSQMYLAEKSASGTSAWTTAPIQIGGVPVAGYPLSIDYDRNNHPWILIQVFGAGTDAQLYLIYQDTAGVWQQLSNLASSNFNVYDGAASTMLSPTRNQIMVVWGEKQAASTTTQYVSNFYGSFVNTDTKTVSAPAILGANLSDTPSGNFLAQLGIQVASSNDGTRGMVEVYGAQTHALWFGAVALDKNGSSEFLPLVAQSAFTTSAPSIFYDQCGDIASALIPGSDSNSVAGTTVEELDGF